MRCISLKNKAFETSLTEAILTGMAPDGGLFYPKTFPISILNDIQKLFNKDLKTIAAEVLYRWFMFEFERNVIEDLVSKSFTFPITLKEVGPYTVLELFHGPTQAFKDVAARFLAQLIGYVLKQEGATMTLLAATSGDTGGAIAQAFAGVKAVNVFILYPKGKISKLQEAQATRVADNITPLEVDGVYDDCQNLVKAAIADIDLTHLNLTSANSLNLGRLIPQMVYYVYAYSQLQKNNLEFFIPSGNLGNIVTGLFTAQCGFPLKHFVAAINSNDAFIDYYQTGIFKPKSTVKTLSNAMDVGNPSNFERLLAICNHDYAMVKRSVGAVRIDEQLTANTIKNVYKKYNYLLDPHTAVAWAAAEQTDTRGKTSVIVSTAAPEKFAEEIKKVTDITIDNSALFASLQKFPKKVTLLKNDFHEFKRILIKSIH